MPVRSPDEFIALESRKGEKFRVTFSPARESYLGARISRRSPRDAEVELLTAGDGDVYDGGAFDGRKMMAKSRLKKVATAIGAAVGSADRKAHQVVKAGGVAKKELAAISKQIDALKKQLMKTSKRMQKALS